MGSWRDFGTCFSGGGGGGGGGDWYTDRFIPVVGQVVEGPAQEVFRWDRDVFFCEERHCCGFFFLPSRLPLLLTDAFSQGQQAEQVKARWDIPVQ